MRRRGTFTGAGRILTLPLALALLLPVLAWAEVDATVEVGKRQDQGGEVIRVTAAISAHEPLTADGRGRVRVGGKSHPLFPKGTPRELSADSGFALKLIPKPRVAGLIAEALNDGLRPPARITVILSDGAGEVESTSYRVRLTR